MEHGADWFRIRSGTGVPVIVIFAHLTFVFVSFPSCWSPSSSNHDLELEIEPSDVFSHHTRAVGDVSYTLIEHEDHAVQVLGGIEKSAAGDVQGAKVLQLTYFMAGNKTLIDEQETDEPKHGWEKEFLDRLEVRAVSHTVCWSSLPVTNACTSWHALRVLRASCIVIVKKYDAS